MIAPKSLGLAMAAHNAQDSIMKALNSVRQQGNFFSEVVVVDDGSTDNTYEILQGIKQGMPILKIIKQENLGPAFARNRAFSELSSTWLTYLDADDILADDYVEKMNSLVADYEDFDVFMPNGLRIAPCGDRQIYRELSQPHIVTFEEMVVGCQTISAGSLMRKSTWDKYGGFDQRYPQAQDYDLWLRMLIGGERLVMSPEPVYLYFTKPSSVSANPMRNLCSTKTILSNIAKEQEISSSQKGLIKRVVRDKSLRIFLAMPVEALRKLLQPILGDRGNDFFFKMYTSAATSKRKLAGSK